MPTLPIGVDLSIFTSPPHDRTYWTLCAQLQAHAMPGEADGLLALLDRYRNEVRADALRPVVRGASGWDDEEADAVR